MSLPWTYHNMFQDGSQQPRALSYLAPAWSGKVTGVVVPRKSGGTQTVPGERARQGTVPANLQWGAGLKMFRLFPGHQWLISNSELLYTRGWFSYDLVWHSFQKCIWHHQKHIWWSSNKCFGSPKRTWNRVCWHCAKNLWWVAFRSKGLSQNGTDPKNQEKTQNHSWGVRGPCVVHAW